jgi:tetraacyldisaccharide 4'-kinase
MSLAKRLERAWWRADGKDWLSLALLDVSWLFGGLVKLRHKLYSSGVFDQTRLTHAQGQAVPVIVVGNVIAGGAGKTPITIELAKFLQSRGYSPGIVSRGYGRKGRATLEVLPDTPLSESGDEPALIAQSTGCPVFVGADRVEAAQALIAAHPSVNVILSDDGLQHLALQRDVEIIVFDERGVGNGRLQPAGPLREPWPRHARSRQQQPEVVSFVLHRGGFEEGFEIERELADFAVRRDGSRVRLSELAGHPCIALAGIAHPQAFFSPLSAKGVQLQETIPLPDHYNFDSAPRRFNAGDKLICTEKDAIKLHQADWAQPLEILAVPLHISLPLAFTQAIIEKLSSQHGHQTA